MVLYQAYQDGLEPLSRQVRAQETSATTKTNDIVDTSTTRSIGSDNRPVVVQQEQTKHQYDMHQKRPLLSQQQLKQLSTKGCLVIDNFLTPQQLQDAIQSAQQVQFGPSGNEKEEQSALKRDRVRTDQVFFLSASSSSLTNNGDREKGGGLEAVQTVLRGVAPWLIASGFGGFHLDEGATRGVDSEPIQGVKQAPSARGWIGVPDGMQISLYDGSHEEKGTESATGQGDDDDRGGGDYYLAHVDGCSDSVAELGLLGWLRSIYLRRRYITCILYLNATSDEEQEDGWDTDRDGGCLRVFHHHRRPDDDENDNDHSEFDDIAPMGGRLVLFSAQHMVHAVLPTFRRRLACTVWLTLNPD
uniref:Fe2OG dioxygenase domain-containing protein n=1 Tax=Grammatophora oceanica TaxID=210454 RepID=A0A7S1UVY2_9STRA